MAEREIRYCTTEDGVRIAYWTMGDGKPLVHLPPGSHCHIERELEQPELAHWYRLLAARYQLIRYDSRGFGASQRGPDVISLDTMVLDLSAVVDALQLDQFALFAAMIDGAVACSYAASNAARVAHLILWNASPGGIARRDDPVQAALYQIAEDDWRAFTSANARQQGWPRSDQSRSYALMLRDSTDGATYLRQVRAFQSFDVLTLLADISAQALVVHHPDYYEGRKVFVGGSPARELSSRIPNARMVALDGVNYCPWVDIAEADRSFPVVRAFLDGEDAISVSPGAPLGVTTVLFTDLVGHTEMMSRLGDEAGRAVLREHERITREVLRDHGGVEVKTMGDGFMASFGSVTKAVECAIALQRAVEARNAVGAHGDAPSLHLPPPTLHPLSVRVGLNAGEPIAEEGDLFGATVILASRIAAQASAGEILIPEPVRHLLAGKDFVFADHGEFLPKGFEDAVRLFEVRWRE